MAMLHGQYRLVILKTHRRNRITTRYVASVEAGADHVGHKVTVKFRNCGHLPDDFIERTGDFDGDQNDIRDYGDRIDQHRNDMDFPNPFV